MKNRLIIGLLASTFLFSNIISTPTIARELLLDSNKNKVVINTKSSKKALSGSVDKTEKMNEIIELQTPVTYDVFKHSEGDKDYFLLMPKLPDIAFSDTPEKKELNTKKRLHDCLTLLMIGGLSVSGSVEREMGAGTSEERFFRNMKKPIISLKEGWERDQNSFWINYVGHPGEFFLLSNYMKTLGASDKEAFLLAKFVNFTWEYIYEGTYVPPSPKDLISDIVGAITGIYFYNKIGKNHFPQFVDKVNSIGEKHEIKFNPKINYNNRTRGVAVGLSITKKL